MKPYRQSLVSRFAFGVARRLPHRHWLENLCKTYLRRHSGEGNGDMATNGEMAFMRRYLPGCKVVLDVGANHGDWTAMALDINQDIEIHCLEPCQKTYDTLVSWTLPPNVHCHCVGLSSRSEERDLYGFSGVDGMNSLYARINVPSLSGLGDPRTVGKARLVTLDDFARENGLNVIDMVKIDTEGHELAILQGASKNLESGTIRCLQFEYGGTFFDAHVRVGSIFALLGGYGYTIHRLVPNGMIHVHECDSFTENFEYKNFVAFRGDETDFP